MIPPRKAGFYWVRHLGFMPIAQWCNEGGEWFLIGIEKESNHITDKELEFIGWAVV